MNPPAPTHSKKTSRLITTSIIGSLIAFIGVGVWYYKKSADETYCTFNQSSIMKEADSYMGINSLSSVSYLELCAPHGPFAGDPPRCPCGGKYDIEVSNSSVQQVNCSYHGVYSPYQRPKH